MKNLLFNFFFSLFTILSFSQIKTIKGKIRNSETKSYIQFVNIGIQNKSVGTVSNAAGIFSLELKENVKNNDTITISHIGYKTIKLLCNQLDNENNIVELEPEQEYLNEVMVKFVKPKKKKIGRSVKGLGLMHMNFYSFYEKNVDDRLSKEVGMKFKLRKDCKINNFNFNITSNEFKSLKFRLNFYKVESGLPTKIIVDKDIIFEINNGYLGWYNLDLRPYNILIDKEIENIAVTIQWLESIKLNDQSKYFGMSTAISTSETSIFREKSMDTWKESKQSLSFYLDCLCK